MPGLIREAPGKYKYINTATTTVVKSTPGTLTRIIIGQSANGAITIYDNSAGSGDVVNVLAASIVEGVYEFNAKCLVGLTIVTAAASKLTIVYD